MTAPLFVEGYDDVVAVLDDGRLTNDRMHGFADRAPAAAVHAIGRHAAWLISADGADYDWVGAVVHAGLRGAVSTASRQAIAATADALLDDLVGRERFDLARDYALALSGHVLADMLGVDRRDSARLIGWANDLVAFYNDVDVDVTRAEGMARSAAEMAACMQAIAAAPRGAFVEQAARTAAAHGQALDAHGLGHLALPFLTGQVGVAQLVVNTAWLLLTHPGERARLSADPGLLAGAIAETLRYLPPAGLIPRVAIDHVTVGGQAAGPGSVVWLNIAAANRDARFADPELFDIGRRNSGALGFGHGPHACVGAGLSRIQAAIALEALLRRAPDFALDPDGDVVWHAVPGTQGPEVRPVRTYSSARSSSGSVTGRWQAKRSHT